MSTLHVHFYAGPGVGKSTTNALAFGELKLRDRNVEMIHEYAKERAWDGTLGTLDQREAAVEQMKRHARLEGKVEATLSDTSILLGLIYGQGRPETTLAFQDWIMDEYNRMRTLNIFLERNPSRPYNEAGREQTFEEAQEIDEQIAIMLEQTGQEYKTFMVGRNTIGEIVNFIEHHI